MISIVIPLYNKAAFVRRTIDSVQAQIFEDWEIVVVDDGSKDDGPEIVASYEDSRIRLLRQANGGVSRARNAGISVVRGEWVAFLDADDWLHPRYLSALNEVIAGRPDVNVVGTRYRNVDWRDAAHPAWKLAPSDEFVEEISDLPARWQRAPSFFTSSVAVRASLLRKMAPCFPEGESFGEDLDLWFRLGEQGPIMLSHLPLVARIFVPQSLSSQHSSLLEAPFLTRMEQRAARGEINDLGLARSTRKFVNQSRVTLARASIVRGHRGLALGLLWRARGGARSPRWWVTCAMLACVPGGAVSRWQEWRVRRKAVS